MMLAIAISKPAAEVLGCAKAFANSFIAVTLLKSFSESVEDSGGIVRGVSSARGGFAINTGFCDPRREETRTDP
jgi:hypothetical protein